LDLNFEFAVDGGEKSEFATDLLFLSDSLYANIEKVPSNIPELTQVLAFQGNWYKFPITSDFKNQPGFSSLFKNSSTSNLSKEDLALEELYYQTKFFKEIKS